MMQGIFPILDEPPVSLMLHAMPEGKDIGFA